MITDKLNPGCQIAWRLCDLESQGVALSIEMLRAILESAPTYPESWLRCEGADYTDAWLMK